MSTTENPRDDSNRLTEFAKGAVDTAVGLGVLGLQKLQVSRVELHKRLTRNEAVGTTYSELRSRALRQASWLDGVATEVRRSIEASLNPVTGRLPGPARHAATVAQGRIDELHGKISRHLASAAHREPSADGPTGD
jgi:hypothetical protein